MLLKFYLSIVIIGLLSNFVLMVLYYAKIKPFEPGFSYDFNDLISKCEIAWMLSLIWPLTLITFILLGVAKSLVWFINKINESYNKYLEENNRGRKSDLSSLID